MNQQEKLAAWLAREMPAGTVIGDPTWWAPRIIRVLATPPAPTVAPSEMTDERIVEIMCEVTDAYTRLPIGLLVKAGRAILAAQAAAAPVMAVPEGWICMADQMPPKGESVLIFYPMDAAEPWRIDMWDEWHEDPIGMGGKTVCVGEGWMSFGDDEITHWMPLPQPPAAPTTEGGEHG